MLTCDAVLIIYIINKRVVLQLMPKPERRIITEFADREDLIQWLIASCFIPMFLAPKLFMRYDVSLDCTLCVLRESEVWCSQSMVR